MRIVFFGTPVYVIPILADLHRAFKGRAGESGVVAVVTQTPKPAGREKKLTYSPVDSWTHQKKIPIFYKAEDLIKNNIQADLGVLAAYGEIIPKLIISHFKFGILNVHPSLLPKFRGASPVQATIATGEKETGVTIIRLDEKLDHGPIISQFKEDVASDDTTGALRERLFARSAKVLITLIPAYTQGKITPRSQNDKEATFTTHFTTQVTKDHGYIPGKILAANVQGYSLTIKGGERPKSWKIPFLKNSQIELSALSLERFIRAMDPWPGAWTYVRLTEKQKNERTEKRLKILKAHLENLYPKRYTLIPDLVQLEGKTPVSWKQFTEGYPNLTFE